MKKVFIIILICSIIICFVFINHGKQKQDNLFILKGWIEGVDSGVLRLNYINSFSQYIRDTVHIINEHFEFQGYICEPTKANLIEEEEFFEIAIFLEPGLMEAFVPKGKFSEIELTGSKTQEELNELKLFNTSFDFIQSSPSSYVSLSLLDDYLFSGKYDPEMLDSLNILFESLDLLVQNSKNGKKVKWELGKRGKNQIGNFASDFLERDINGQAISLSNFRDKNVVLLDFWASWCIPCREAFPFLKDVYEKYHLVGLDIIAIALDYDKEAWMRAINKDGINNWYHILRDDPQELQSGQFFGTFIRKNSVRDNYFIGINGGVPFYLLIDKNGKVVARWHTSAEMKEEIIQMLDRLLTE